MQEISSFFRAYAQPYQTYVQSDLQMPIDKLKDILITMHNRMKKNEANRLNEVLRSLRQTLSNVLADPTHEEYWNRPLRHKTFKDNIADVVEAR